VWLSAFDYNQLTCLQEALNYFKIESEDVLRTDIIEVERILDEMGKKGSGRTAVKGKVVSGFSCHSNEC
jgi:hypothetical protein